MEKSIKMLPLARLGLPDIMTRWLIEMQKPSAGEGRLFCVCLRQIENGTC